ncbi:uncharacterized protein Dwil_GK27747 [Drosophila willistoni]|uniref:Uncharacterized protein n=1 Tax=Drosophila willistoni TaxID=7260 RepID=A0A0Q9X334_DROWI|nr:uncharacterized protein LOC26529749 [Drosophila willistoni]KRF98679.1 uncharacterized protein Dwil_GK27747 [Drosophila willistoni]
MIVKELKLVVHRICRHMCSISPIGRDAILLIIHNTFLLYYIINRFKHLAQASINSPGPVNTFHYMPLVYETPVLPETDRTWNAVLKTSTWQYFESVFLHNMALMLPFILTLTVSNYKLLFMCSLLCVSNLFMLLLFTSLIAEFLYVNGLKQILQLSVIFCLGPVCQFVLVCRLLDKTWVDVIVEFDWNGY